MKKSFPLSHVLSITTGLLLCDIDGVYEILNHVTGDNLFTHVLPRAFKFAKPLVLEQYPELELAGSPHWVAKLRTLLDDSKALGSRETPETALKMWLRWVQEPGACNLAPDYDIQSHSESWLSLDPIAEAQSLFSL